MKYTLAVCALLAGTNLVTAAEPITVGNGWSFANYIPGDWDGDGQADLLVRTKAGDMLVYPFKNGTFYNAGDPVQVGNGWNLSHYLPGDWDGDGQTDLLVRTQTGDMVVYPFKNGTFY
jgi:hypothetical protein